MVPEQKGDLVSFINMNQETFRVKEQKAHMVNVCLLFLSES